MSELDIERLKTIERILLRIFLYGFGILVVGYIILLLLQGTIGAGENRRLLEIIYGEWGTPLRLHLLSFLAIMATKILLFFFVFIPWFSVRQVRKSLERKL